MVWNITVMTTELVVVLNNAPGSYANANHSPTTLGTFQQQSITNLPRHPCQHTHVTQENCLITHGALEQRAKENSWGEQALIHTANPVHSHSQNQWPGKYLWWRKQQMRTESWYKSGHLEECEME